MKWHEVNVAQSYLTLCDPMDYTVHGILQTRILERVAFPFSRESSQNRDRTQVSRIVGGFFTSWATREAQEYWSGLPCPPPGDLPSPGIEPRSPTLQEDSLLTEPPGKLSALAWVIFQLFCKLKGWDINTKMNTLLFIQGQSWCQGLWSSAN